MADKIAEVEAPVTDLMSLGSITGSMERPKSLDPNDHSGTEDIKPEDMILPRLVIAQQMSPQMDETKGEYMKDLKNFDMFNDIYGTIYGRGPLNFVPVKRSVTRIQWDPENRGVPLDRDVPANDPRTKWTKDENGKGVPPLATEYVEFVVLLLQAGKMPDPIVLSIKTTNKFQARAAKLLTTFIGTRNAPIFAGLYTIASTPSKNDSGTFGTFVPKNNGWIPKDTPGGAALYKYAEEFAKSLEGKEIVVQRETGEDDQSNGDNGAGPQGAEDDIPF